MPQSVRTDPESGRAAMSALKSNFSSDGLMSLELAVKQALTALPKNSGIQKVELSKTFTNEFVEAR